MQKYSRLAKALGYSLYKKELSNARNSYFNLIKNKKKKHQNNFLEKEDTQSIFKAMSYTINTSQQSMPSIYSKAKKQYKSTF